MEGYHHCLLSTLDWKCATPTRAIWQTEYQIRFTIEIYLYDSHSLLLHEKGSWQASARTNQANRNRPPQAPVHSGKSNQTNTSAITCWHPPVGLDRRSGRRFRPASRPDPVQFLRTIALYSLPCGDRRFLSRHSWTSRYDRTPAVSDANSSVRSPPPPPLSARRPHHGACTAPRTRKGSPPIGPWVARRSSSSSMPPRRHSPVMTTLCPRRSTDPSAP